MLRRRVHGEFPVEVRESVQEQLANVRLGDGVAAIDTFVSQLPEEIAKEEIDGAGGGKIIDIGEDLCGGSVIPGLLEFQAVEMVMTKVIVARGDEHATAMAA